jgi:hypothetical protein
VYLLRVRKGADPERISCHDARRQMKAFLHEIDPEGKGMQTRTVTVEIPDVDLSELDWPEGALLAHFAFGTPNPISAEYEPEPDEV